MTPSVPPEDKQHERLSGIGFEQMNSGRAQRSMRNYLIDARFQLKYAGYLVGVTLAISLLLGAFLWRTSSQVIEKSKAVSEQGRITIQTVYGDNPELAKSYAEEAVKADALVSLQQRSMMTGIVGGLGVLVVLVGMLGVFVTHKVAGPVHKMKFLLRNVAEGRLRFSVRALRKGDELQDFFDEFIVMIDKLKERQRSEIARLDEAIGSARAKGADASALAQLEALREEMQRSLEA